MQDDIGKLIVRLTTGALLLFHGIHKLLVGIAPIKTMLADHRIPDVLAYGVYLGEIAAPVLLILGLFSRVGGLLVVVNMIVAIALVGMPHLAALTGEGGYALELETFFLSGGLAVMFLGAGRFGIAGGRWN